MSAAKARGLLVVLLVTAVLVRVGVAVSSAQGIHPPASGATDHAERPAHAPAAVGTAPDASPQHAREAEPAVSPADADRKAQIQALDEKITALRTQFKSQADPLQDQLKGLREKFDSDLKSLQDQKRALVEQGESPALVALNQDEASQLASLGDREKAEIDKLRASYEEQKKSIQQDFQRRRLELGKK